MIIDAKQEYGILADGSDETAKIAAAITRMATDTVYFGHGNFAAADLPTITFPPSMMTAGRAHTKFTNLSPTSRFFELQGHGAPPPAGPGYATSFSDFGGFTLNQNGCTGSGIKVGAQHTHLRSVHVQNQGPVGYAVDAYRATCSRFVDIIVTTSVNGMRARETFYPRLDQINIERTSGIGLDVISCVEVNADAISLHVAGGTWPTSQELMRISGCFDVSIRGLSAEIDFDGKPLTARSYFLIENSESVRINDGWCRHGSDGGTVCESRALFLSANSIVDVAGINWRERSGAMHFAMVDPGNRGLTLDRITTNIVTPSKSPQWSKHLVGGVSNGPLSITNIRHTAEVPTNY